MLLVGWGFHVQAVDMALSPILSRLSVAVAGAARYSDALTPFSFGLFDPDEPPIGELHDF